VDFFSEISAILCVLDDVFVLADVTNFFCNENPACNSFFPLVPKYRFLLEHVEVT